MKRRIWTIAAGLAAVVAVVCVPAAYAAYTTAKLEVRPAATGGGAFVRATLSPDDDPTFRVQIFAPRGATLTTNQAPGTVLGPVRAVVKALDLGGADLPVEGQLAVAPPGAVPPATQAQCLQGATPLAVWVMTLGAAGQTLPPVPAYLVATTGAQAAIGPAYIQVCLPPPDVPAGTPGRATFGAKLYSAELTINGVFSSTAGTWLAIWTPWRPGVGQVNAAGTIASPGVVAPGAVTVTARRRGAGATVSGRVTQGGQPRAGANVSISGGARSSRLRRLGNVRTNAQGAFSFRARSGVFFRANVTAAAGTAPAACTAITPAIAPVPCVNPTSNGFTAQSRVVRKR
jgi:hypothetical protein